MHRGENDPIVGPPGRYIYDMIVGTFDFSLVECRVQAPLKSLPIDSILLPIFLFSFTYNFVVIHLLNYLLSRTK